MTTLAVHRPGEPLAVGEGAPRTPADLDADSRRIAAFLAGKPAGEVVLICNDRYFFAAAMQAIWAAGHVVRLPPNGQPEAVRAASAGPGFRALLHDVEGAEGVYLPDLLLRAQGQAEEPAPERAGGSGGPSLTRTPRTELPELVLPPLDRHLVTITTSGSTGAHQLWPKTGRQLVAEGELVARAFGAGPGARVLSTVPPHHIYGLLWGVLMPLRGGAVMLRQGPLHAEAVIAEIERHRATHVVSVPAHLAALAAADRAPSGITAFSSGAPLPLATARALRERHGWRVIEIYGSTETGGIGSREDPEQGLWTPFPDATVSADLEGALLVDSTRIDPAAPRPYRVPDRIELREDGRFALLGRMDGVVKVAGKRISLREIEERLLAVPGVRDAAALAQPSSGLRGEEIWVAVAAVGQTPERLRQALSAWFDPVALPRRIRVLDALPREATGKLVREKLRAVFDAPALARPAMEEWFSRPARLVPESEAREDVPGKDVRRLTFTVDPRLRWFEGHFPGLPVLPGVAQLEGLVLYQVERLWPEAGPLRVVKRLKYSRIIHPGDRVAVVLERDAADGTVGFAIEGPHGRCASGTLVLGGSR